MCQNKFFNLEFSLRSKKTCSKPYKINKQYFEIQLKYTKNIHIYMII